MASASVTPREEERETQKEIEGERERERWDRRGRERDRVDDTHACWQEGKEQYRKEEKKKEEGEENKTWVLFIGKSGDKNGHLHIFLECSK